MPRLGKKPRKQDFGKSITSITSKQENNNVQFAPFVHSVELASRATAGNVVAKSRI